MGATLQMASEKGAYTLTDQGTFLAYQSNLTLVPLVTQGTSLLNIYSVMAVYNTQQPVAKIQEANEFINFLLSPQTQADIGKIRRTAVREVTLHPDGCECPQCPRRLGRRSQHPGKRSHSRTRTGGHNTPGNNDHAANTTAASP